MDLDVIRNSLDVFLIHLIENRDELANEPLELDLDEARSQAERILTEHGQAISELSTGAIFDLISLSRREPYDSEAYASMLAKLEDEQLVAQIEATSESIEAARDRIERRKDLAAEVLNAANVAVRGVLWAALVSAGLPLVGGVTPNPPPAEPV